MILEEEAHDLATPSGTMRTYVYRPAGAEQKRFPAIVLFSEIFQRTSPIGRIAAMLAGHGFVVAVPEIFHELEPAGTVLSYDKAGADAGNRHKTEKTASAYDADSRAVIDHLVSRQDCDGTVFSMGVCIGGHLAFRAAFDVRVLASACFYATDIHTGSLGLGGDDSLARAHEITGKLMMVWGRQDPHIPEEGRKKIRARVDEVGVDLAWYEFDAQHAFLRDEGPRYDPALALISYRMVLDWFGATAVIPKET